MFLCKLGSSVCFCVNLGLQYVSLLTWVRCSVCFCINLDLQYVYVLPWIFSICVYLGISMYICELGSLPLNGCLTTCSFNYAGWVSAPEFVSICELYHLPTPWKAKTHTYTHILARWTICLFVSAQRGREREKGRAREGEGGRERGRVRRRESGRERDLEVQWVR